MQCITDCSLHPPMHFKNRPFRASCAFKANLNPLGVHITVCNARLITRRLTVIFTRTVRLRTNVGDIKANKNNWSIHHQLSEHRTHSVLFSSYVQNTSLKEEMFTETSTYHHHDDYYMVYDRHAIYIHGTGTSFQDTRPLGYTDFLVLTYKLSGRR